MKDNSCDAGYAQSIIVSQEFFYSLIILTK